MVTLGSVTVDDTVASCVRTAAARYAAPEGYMAAYAWLETLFDPSYFTDPIGGSPNYFQLQRAWRNPADAQLYAFGGLFHVHFNTAAGAPLRVDELVTPAGVSRIVAGYFRAGLVDAVFHNYSGDTFVSDVFGIVHAYAGFRSLPRAATDPAGMAILTAHGWNGNPQDDLSIEKAALAALGVSVSGATATWPPNDPSLCGGIINPPPPLGAWCEPFIPTDAGTADQLYTAHLDRMQALSEAF